MLCQLEAPNLPGIPTSSEETDQVLCLAFKTYLSTACPPACALPNPVTPCSVVRLHISPQQSPERVSPQPWLTKIPILQWTQFPPLPHPHLHRCPLTQLCSPSLTSHRLGVRGTPHPILEGTTTSLPSPHSLVLNAPQPHGQVTLPSCASVSSYEKSG